MDVTYTPDLGHSLIASPATRKHIEFPSQPAYQNDIRPLLSRLSKSNMKQNLEGLTSFYTRYYKSQHGVESAEWLHGLINETILSAGADKHGVKVARFEHPWGQPSLIATIPGKTDKTVIIGAHQDSINLFLPSILPAPGADDDGSGTVTILEAFRVLLSSPNITHSPPAQTVEFHWYAAEEGGLLGSQAVFSQYAQENRNVMAMLQQDMTGYVQRTIQAGRPESVSVVTDYVSPGLTEFIKKIITEYCDIPYALTKCGYACSDHASATKAGYPSAFVIESVMSDDNPFIHTKADTIDHLDFDHMLQHAKLTLAAVWELAFAEFED